MSATTSAPSDKRTRSAAGEGPLRRVRRRRLAAPAAVVVGVFMTSVGAGLGLRYAVKTAASVNAVVGLALLVVGLVLLGFGAVVSWRSVRRWWRLGVAPVALVVAAVTGSLALGVAYSVAPRTALGGATPADRRMTYTTVGFRTADGVRLAGWLVASRNRGAVVVVPGSGSTRTATLDQAAVLARHGYGVLMVDPRGQGRSGGAAMDLGWWGDRDVTAAVGFLARQPGVDRTRIGVLGLSMGAEEAIGASRADPRITAVVAEGATGRTDADKAGWLPGGVAGALQRGFDWLTYRTVDVLSPAPRPTSLHAAIAGATTTRFLLVTAGTLADELRAARYLRSAAPDRVDVWTVTGASHTRGLRTAPREWETRVTAFLDRTLGITTG
jgi:uncharacterized protein